MGESLAVWIGGTAEAVGPRSPLGLLEQVAAEVTWFPSPADALDGLCARREHLPLARRLLFVVDQRRAAEVCWTWLSLLVHLGLGPVILLVDRVDEEIARRAVRAGVRCLDERELAGRPGVLVRAARRALAAARVFEHAGPATPATIGS